MPTLIPEVLERIASEFRYQGKSAHPKIEEITSNSNELVKFMLSGRKPFNSTLTYFSRADRIAVWKQYFVVTIKNFTTDRFNTLNKHYFPYDFVLMKSLLNALFQSNGTLEIHEETGGKNVILDALITPDLKKVTLFAKLNSKYFKEMKSKCSLEKIRVAYNFSSNFDFFNVPASCHEIVSSFGNARISLGDIPEKSAFPQVKELNIFWMDLNTVTTDTLIRQSRLITEKFPVLEKLYIVYNVSIQTRNIGHAVAAIQPSAFNVIPANINGVIHFELGIHESDYKNISRELSNDPAVKLDSTKKLFAKNLMIHDNLFVIFKINTEA